MCALKPFEDRIIEVLKLIPSKGRKTAVVVIYVLYLFIGKSFKVLFFFYSLSLWMIWPSESEFSRCIGLKVRTS